MTEDATQGWAGDFAGRIVDLGVYMHVIDITYRDGAGVNAEGLKWRCDATALIGKLLIEH